MKYYEFPHLSPSRLLTKNGFKEEMDELINLENLWAVWVTKDGTLYLQFSGLLVGFNLRK